VVRIDGDLAIALRDAGLPAHAAESAMSHLAAGRLPSGAALAKRGYIVACLNSLAGGPRPRIPGLPMP
jgi:hypothetical protein